MSDAEFNLLAAKFVFRCFIVALMITVAIVVCNMFSDYLDFYVANQKVTLFYGLMEKIADTTSTWLNQILEFFK